MVKALVTLGYHYGELDWGRQVRDNYNIKGLQDNRDIVFHEVKNSDVETGYPCKSSADEIEQIVRREDFGLLIDIHCGFDIRYEKRPLGMEYYGMDDEKIRRAKEINGLNVDDWRQIPLNAPLRSAKFVGVPSALADAFFSKEEYLRKGSVYQAKLERTLKFINEIYDIHKF